MLLLPAGTHLSHDRPRRDRTPSPHSNTWTDCCSSSDPAIILYHDVLPKLRSLETPPYIRIDRMSPRIQCYVRPEENARTNAALSSVEDYGAAVEEAPRADTDSQAIVGGEGRDDDREQLQLSFVFLLGR